MTIDANHQDPTAAACERLFDLMALEPPRRYPTTTDTHDRMMAAYTAMFGQPPEELSCLD